MCIKKMQSRANGQRHAGNEEEEEEEEEERNGQRHAGNEEEGEERRRGMDRDMQGMRRKGRRGGEEWTETCRE